MTRAAVYVRISDDREGRSLGVERQEQDCRSLALRRGYDVVSVYADNDISASTRSRKIRPDYRRLLADAAERQFDVVLASTQGRVTRRPRENEDLIELAERYGTRYEYVSSPRFDLNTADGRMMARIVAAADAAEAERIGERTTRKLQQRREAGLPHGGHRPYGWEPDRMTIRESEAAVIRESVPRLLAGEPIRALIRDLNARGLHSSTGKPWKHVTFRKMIMVGRHAGILTHLDQEVGPAAWPAIVAPESWRALVRMLSDPARSVTPGRGGKLHLLSGVATCGVCGGPIRVGQSRTSAKRGGTYLAYRCQQKWCVSRRQDLTDQYVQTAVIAYLSRPDAADLFSPEDDGGERERAAEAAERVRHRLDEAALAFADGMFTRRQVEEINARLRPELEALEAASAPAPDRARALAGLVGAQDVRAVWEALTPDKRRAVVKMLLAITIHPGRRGNVFSTKELELTWL